MARITTKAVSLRALLALCLLGAVPVLASSSPAAAASACPTATFLSFDHLAYASKRLPASVRLAPGARLGIGQLDSPASADGCKRKRETDDVLAAGQIEPEVAVMVKGRPRTVFVIGHRCDGFAAQAYWDCLLRPLVFRGTRFTATSYPRGRRTVPLGAALGTGQLDGRTVTVRRIVDVDPAIAVGVSGRPSEGFLAAATCPYEGFTNAAAYDDLLRCLRSPVWFTFDPPGGDTGATVVGRADRAPGSAAGAPIGLVRLPRVADYVPARHADPVHVGRVARQVSIDIPDVPSGLYEAVVSDSGGKLYPAGSFLVTAKPKTSTGIRVVSYLLTAALVGAVLMLFLSWRRRRRARAGS
jgi:hypothetical protein